MIEKLIKQAREQATWDIPESTQQLLLQLAEVAEKQVAKAPFVWKEQYVFGVEFTDDWGYECPCCGNANIDLPDSHCSCGQKLDWSDYE